ncbi:peptidyl-tRNA hydrolase [Ligilactobacillus sp. WC1T17]|uniref:Peptidyl-tRNA hydrolase n=1 Tax=Ligilactobacillus ruminis TaxID=1623 RepID=A0ABY1ACD1_9LACO|nr:peptidyl-tRNA hydrolase [Ligilactobacillus ruminis]
MKLIVGLGNIGKEYEGTRHNAGFMTVDAFAKEHGLMFNKQKFDAMLAEGMVAGQKVLLAKPTTYMNESGQAVKQIVAFYKLDVEDLIIVHDDMDLEVGKLRLRQKGSAGGHNGIKSIIKHLGTEKFKRARLGIGHPEKMTVVDWVLGRFSQSEKVAFEAGLGHVVSALDDWLENDNFMQTMNKFN